MHDARVAGSARTDRPELNDLVLAMARWLDAAQTVVDDTEARLAALEEARRHLATWATVGAR